MEIKPGETVEVEGMAVIVTEKERQFLLNLLIKLPITVTLENINNNKTVSELVALVQKFQRPEEPLNSEGADATIIAEEG